jgi:thymidylate synthase
MRVSHPLEEPMISRCFIGGAKELQQYVMEMLDGILDFEVEQGKWTYTYHQRMGEQVQFVIDELRRNPSSRRAVISIRTPDDIGSDDPACLQHLQYFIRHDKLDCVVLFRSNDACKATFMNAFALIMLQKRIADALGVEIGQYVHRANSFHCYEKDFTLLDGYVHRIKNQSLSMLTYNYEDDWKELMEDEIPDILAQVEELKSHGKQK